MAVFPGQFFDVERDPRIHAEGGEKFLHKLGVKTADLLGGDGQIKAQEAPARHIHRRENQRLVHRQGRIPVADDAALVAQGFLYRTAQADADILHAVVVVHLRVARAFECQVEAPVTGKEGEHVVEKSYAGVDAALPRPVKIQGQGDIGLGGLAVYGSASHLSSSSISRTFLSRMSICSRVPMVMRFQSLMRSLSKWRISTARSRSFV